MAHLSTFRTQIFLSAGVTALVLAMAVSPAMAASRLHAASRSFSRTSEAAACGLPLVHDRYSGFHVGVPAGWQLATLNGAIGVTKDPAGTEMATIYPALLTKDLTPANFFAGYSKILQRIATAAGNAITFHLISKPGQLPRAIVAGRIGKLTEQGRAEVLLLDQRTALATRQLVFAAYWAPPARLTADGAMLARIGRCYGPEAGTFYQIYRDQDFGMVLPQGWSVADEGQDNIDIMGDSRRAMASYLLMMVPASVGATTPRTLLQYVLDRAHIQIGMILSSTDTPAQQVQGAVQGSEILEFTGTYQGKSVHGVVSIYCLAGPSATTGVMRLGMATSDRWNAVNSGLIRLTGSIQHSFAQDQAQIDHLTHQQQQNAQVQQQFDNVINGVQDVQDPSTGTVYEAPYDAYSPNGPNGPGYYLNQGGTLVQLQVVNHQ